MLKITLNLKRIQQTKKGFLEHQRQTREVIRSGEFDHPVNPDRDVRLDRNNQDDWSLSYSIRDIPTFDGKGILYHIHI